jgi:two-component system, sensor histidine kinase
MFARLIHGSIRKKLAILFLLSSLPGILFIFVTSLNNRNESIANAAEDLAGFANQLADAQERVTLNTKMMLENLARLPEVRQGDALTCTKIFATMVKVNPLYGALTLVDIHGDTVASSGPLPGANFAQAKQFKDALSTKEFATGEYNLGETSNQPPMTFACPVFGELGEVAGVLLSSIRLDSYGRQFDLRRFPKDSFVDVCDQNGLRLFRYPAQKSALPGSPLESGLLAAAHGAPEGLTVQTGDDGIQRVIAFRKLRLTLGAPPYMYFFAGIPKASFFAQTQKSMLRDIAVLLATIGVTFLLGWVLGGRTMVQKFEELAENSFRIGLGDHEARVQADSNIKEVDTVAKSFNAMVEVLQQESAYRKETERLLALQTERTQRISELSNDAAYFCLDYNGEFLMDWLSGAQRKVTGHSRAELMEIGDLRELVVEEDKPLYYRHIADLQPGMKGACELRLRKKNGEIVWAHCVAECIAQSENQFRRRIYCGLRDITARKKAFEALAHSQQRYKMLVENAADALFLVDLSGKIIDVNSETVRQTGYSREELLHLNMADLDIQQSPKLVERFVADLRVSGKAEFETVYCRKSGEQYPVALCAVLIPEGENTSLLGMAAKDISQKNQD